MKTSDFWKAWCNIFLKPMIALSALLLVCFILNFMLVTPLYSTIIGTIMQDVRSQTENIDIVFMGSSRTHRSVDTPALSKGLNKNVFNVSYENATFYATYHLLKEVYNTNKLETLVLEISMPNFSRANSTEDEFIYQTLTGENKQDFAKGIDLEFNNSSLFNFTNYLENFSNGRFVKNVKAKFSNHDRIGEELETAHTKYNGNGFISVDHVIDKGSELILPKKSYGKGDNLWEDSYANKLQVEYFHKIMEFCEESEIEVVLYSPPYPYQVTSKHEKDLIEFDNFVKTTIEQYNLDYIDFSKIKKDHMTLSNNYFYNANHCNLDGAKKLQPIILEIFNQIKSGKFEYSAWFYDSFTAMIADYNAQ